MKKEHIGRKILLPYIILLVLLVACVAIGVSVMLKSRAQMKSIYFHTDQVKQSVDTLSLEFVKMQNSVYQAAYDGDIQAGQIASENIKISQVRVNENMALLKNYFLGDLSLLTECEQALQMMMPVWEEIGTLMESGQAISAQALMQNGILPQTTYVMEKMNAILEDVMSYQTAEFYLMQKIWLTAILGLIVMGIVGLLSGIGCCFYLRQSVIKPVIELKRASGILAENALSAEALAHSKMEIQKLAGDFLTVTTALSNLVQGMNISKIKATEEMGKMEPAVKQQSENEDLPHKS